MQFIVLRKYYTKLSGYFKSNLFEKTVAIIGIWRYGKVIYSYKRATKNICTCKVTSPR